MAAGDRAAAQQAGTHHLDTFARRQLTETYYSEGAAVGDLNGDGRADVVYGPLWYEGPDFARAHEIYPVQAQPRQAYADHFFAWIHDFDRDGRNEILTAGFPGTPAYVYVNPGPARAAAAAAQPSHWEKRQVFDWVSNESPQFTDIVGDAQPELVCTRDGRFGYAAFDPAAPFSPWTFHAISDKIAPERFGHGLGVGDVNGDGRLDLLMKDGWFEQPASREGDPPWTLHRVVFAKAGGAEMFAYDVDGDGDNDVITSLDAHAYGLAWYEHLRDGERIVFRPHTIMGEQASENPYGVLFTEPHSVQLADIDGDGLKDIVTGKTFWSHHEKSPLWDAGAVVYWFRLVRGPDGAVDWVPHLADGQAGIGRQIVVADATGDGLADFVTGGMNGCHLLVHERRQVTESQWRAAQPRRVGEMAAGLAPDEAAARMSVPEGFRVQLAAGEPQVHQPVALAIDARGRVWVAEAYNYPLRAPEGQGLDKIIILEDTDRDGTLDRRTEFATGLNLVSGLEVGFGGVWVGAAPYLLFFPDRDGDDRPDGPAEVLLDGFGYQDTHETLNAFTWGPDGWLYGCHGVFTHSRVGRPGTPDAERTPLNAAVWRYHPTRHVFEVFAHGSSNPWGVDFDERGQAFITACVIPHLYHVIQGGRYQRQSGQHFNPYTYEDLGTIADHPHYAGNIQAHAWWGHQPHAPATTLAAGGGHAHCGAMIYLGDNWPAEYRGGIFMNNIHGNRVNHDRLERHGSGFVGRHHPDLLVANDHWFRGINLRTGPDGSVYLIDWYDKNACHRTTPEIWDRSNGRVYRIVYGDAKPAPVDLSRLPDEELVALQNHANQWYARTSRRLLQERGAKLSAESLARIATDTAAGRLRRMWLEHVLSDGSQVDPRWLDDEDEYVRAWAIQLELEDHRAPGGFIARLAELARSDESPVVRLYVAAGLQRLPAADRWQAAANLIQHERDAEDHNLPLMYWYAIEPLVAEDPARAMDLARTAGIPLVRQFLFRRAAAEPATRDHVVALLVKSDAAATQAAILEEMLRGFEGQAGIPMPASWAAAYDRLAASPVESVRERADQVAVVLGDARIFPRLRAQARDPAAPLERRTQAVEVLVRARDPDAAPTFHALLDEPPLSTAAIRALAAYDHPETTPRLLERYAKFTEDQRREAVGTLLARPASALALLDAIQRGQVPRTDVHAYHVRQLLTFRDAALESRLREVWGQIRETAADRQEKLVAWKARLTSQAVAAADVSNGRRVFDKTCAACHTLFGSGEKIGPDITGSNRANLDYVLENILDPSAVLGKDYRMSTFALDDGRVISGLVIKETDSALTVQTINGATVLARSSIEEQQLSPLSLMPDGQLDQMTFEEARDLIAYLASPAQVPIKGPRAPIDDPTGRVAGSVEGESLKVVGTPPGSARSQKMGGFSKDRWSGADQLWWTGAKPGDRLELEIPVERSGQYAFELVLTRARDYGIVRLKLDGRPLGGEIDLFNSPDVITTGVLSYEPRPFEAGVSKLEVEIAGAHPQAVPAYMFGLDYVRLLPAGGQGK